MESWSDWRANWFQWFLKDFLAFQRDLFFSPLGRQEFFRFHSPEMLRQCWVKGRPILCHLNNLSQIHIFTLRNPLFWAFITFNEAQRSCHSVSSSSSPSSPSETLHSSFNPEDSSLLMCVCYWASSTPMTPPPMTGKTTDLKFHPQLYDPFLPRTRPNQTEWTSEPRQWWANFLTGVRQ